MNYDRYDFLGGENHLRLVLGAYGFWYRCERFGFKFLCPRTARVINIEFCKSNWLDGYSCEVSRGEITYHAGVIFGRDCYEHNVKIFKCVTGASIDLF
jgi:hypothetical protein